jgi:hypothetical protein
MVEARRLHEAQLKNFGLHVTSEHRFVRAAVRDRWKKAAHFQAFSKFGAVSHSSVDGGPEKALSALLSDVHRCFASVAGFQPVLSNSEALLMEPVHGS